MQWETSPHLCSRGSRFPNLAMRPLQRADKTDACPVILVVESPPELSAATPEQRRHSHDALGYHVCSSCVCHLAKRARSAASAKRARSAASKRVEYRALGCCEQADCESGPRFRAGPIARHLWCDTGYGEASTYCLSECAHCRKHICRDHVQATTSVSQQPSVANGFERRKYLQFCVDCRAHVHGDSDVDDM